MTEPTYTIEQIEQAHMAGQADAGVDPSYSNAQAYVRELTRPAHQFREGQVLYFVAKNGDYDFLLPRSQHPPKYHKETNMSWAGWEPLNQTEVGPDWVRLSDILPLVKAIEKALECKSGRVTAIGTTRTTMLHEALDALPPTIRKAAEES